MSLPPSYPPSLEAKKTESKKYFCNSSKNNHQKDGTIWKEENTAEELRDLLTLYRYAKECVLIFWDVMQDPAHATCLNQ